MYRIIVVDDELLALKRFEHIVQKDNRVKLVQTFQDGLSALDFIKENTIDIAFLDIEMPEINGLELANKIQEIDPYINIIFITAYDQYALDAFKAHAIGYLLKPLDINAFLEQITQVARNAEPRKIAPISSENKETTKKLIVRFLGQVFATTRVRPIPQLLSEPPRLMRYLHYLSITTRLHSPNSPFWIPSFQMRIMTKPINCST